MAHTHTASDFDCVHCTAAGTIFETTDILYMNSGFSYLSISIFNSRLAKHLGFDTEKTYPYIGSEINPFCELPDGGSYDPRKCGSESQQRFLWSNFGLCIAYNAIPLDQIYKVNL